MKTTFRFLFCLSFFLLPFTFCLVPLSAQSPQKMSYQAVVRDAADNLITETQVGMQITVLQGSETGTAVYVEVQGPTTNKNGLITIEIGSGTTSDDFSAIQWDDGPFFLKTEIDPEGGSGYSITAVSQILSVPYALHSKTAENVTGALKSQVELLTEQLVLSGLFIKDIDGNIYRTVTIGDQVWLGENLKTTRFNDGMAIPNVTNDATWGSLTAMDAYCWYENEIENKDTYGAIYNWFAVQTGKLCPTGWHVPTQAEWITLMNELGGETEAGGKLKESGTDHWTDPNTGATNETGFTALPAGFRTNSTGNFSSMGSYGYWWSSTDITEVAYIGSVGYNSASLITNSVSFKSTGLSIRCVKD